MMYGDHKLEYNRKNRYSNGQYELIKREICTVNSEITFVTHHNDMLLLGCKCGKIYVVKNDLSSEYAIANHTNEINGLQIENNMVYSSSEGNLIVYRGTTMIHNYKTKSLKGFYVSKSIIYMMFPDKITVFNHNDRYDSSINVDCFENHIYVHNYLKKIYDISIKNADCILTTNTDIIIGGDCLTIVRNNILHNTEIKNTNLVKLEGDVLFFSTLDNTVGFNDYGKNDLRLYSSNVGIVYDFVVRNDIIYVCGEYGIGFIDINNHDTVNLASR